MKREYTFRSIPIVTDPSGETGDTTYVIESARSHSMDIPLRDVLLYPSWIMNFFISLMAVILAFGLIYGVLVIAIKADMGSGSTARRLFLLSMTLSFVALWLSLGIPSAVKGLKMDFVIKERGKGNWKIIDEKEWEHFCRLIKIAEDRRKKLIQEAREKAMER